MFRNLEENFRNAATGGGFFESGKKIRANAFPAAGGIDGECQEFRFGPGRASKGESVRKRAKKYGRLIKQVLELC